MIASCRGSFTLARPGRAIWYNYYSDGRARGATWVEILNTEHLGNSQPGWATGEVKIQRHGWKRKSRKHIYCPTIHPWGNNLWPWGYVWNLDAAGGGNREGAPFECAYGKWVAPKTVHHTINRPDGVLDLSECYGPPLRRPI